MMHNLSKSRYCSGVQCPKMLWLKMNNQEEFDESVMNQAALDNGNEVGDLAMGLFGEYTEVPYDENLGKMIDETQRLLDEGVKNICEASFSYNGCFCSVDILKNLGDKHVKIYEVKSSTDVKDIYLHDVAYQNYVLKKLGYMVDGVYLVHIDKTYTRHGDIELDKLFRVEDMNIVAENLFDDVDMNLCQIKKVLEEKDEPERTLGEHCFEPYKCGFFGHCSAYLPKPNVFDLSGVPLKTKLKCLRLGKSSFEELLTDGKIVNEKAMQQMDHELHDLPASIDSLAIKQFLGELTYPLYFLDFESFNPAIPKYDNSHPYEQICFQYSLHYIEKEGGELKHTEFLAYPGEDPRREFCEKLCADIPLNVCILVYNDSFEKPRIKDMADLYPDLCDHLMNIHKNIKDLMVPFRGRKYYCRAMEGSYSIKYVLPALFPNVPELDYHNLEGVHEGTEASSAFLRMDTMTQEEIDECRSNLLKYCGLDTFAMVKVWEKLREVTEN